MRDAAAHIIVKGRVQGVGFRFFAQEAAETYDLTGWVRNLPDGTVECAVEGPRRVVEQFVAALRKGPPLARVEAVGVDWRPVSGAFSDFSIRP